MNKQIKIAIVGVGNCCSSLIQGIFYYKNISAFKEFALDTTKERIREAELTGASILISCCPFCKTNLREGAESSQSKLKVMDLTEYIEECMEEK